MATHSHMLTSIESSPPKKAAHYNTAAAAARPLHLELGGELAAHRDPLYPGGVGEPVAVRRVRLAGDERLEVAAAGLGDAEAVRANVGRRELLLLVGNFGEGYMPDRSFISPRGRAHDRRHHRVHALYRELHRRLADRVRLVDVDLRCDVARGALQIVGDRPVVLVPIRLAHHVGNHWSHAAELRVTERIARPGLGEKAAVGVCGALGDHDHAIAEVADTAAHALEEFLQLERHFREQDDVRRLGLAAAEPPHIILLPEVPFELEKFLERVRGCVSDFGYCVIVVSEGAAYADGRFLAEAGTRDAFGHAQLGGVAPVVANMVREAYGYKYHWAVADYLQRSARHIASQVDVDQAYAVGKAAVELAVKGVNAVMPTIVRKASKPYKWAIGHVPLAEVANKEKKLPPAYIRADGFGIAEPCRRYLEPLIAGEAYPPYRNGLPDSP